MRSVLCLAVTLCLSGCALGFQFEECSSNDECPVVDGQRLTCTSDRLCVLGTAADKICKDTYPATPPPGAVPLGVIMRLSLQSGADTLLYRAVQLGADEVNSYASTGARPVVLHICDSAGTNYDARKALRVLVEERRVVGVVGPSTSREVIDVAQIAGDAEVPLMSPSATAPALATLPQKDHVYKMAPSDSLQGAAMARVVLRTSNPQVGLIYVNDAYGQGLRGAFVSALGRPLALAQEFAEGAPGPAIDRALAMGNALTDLVVIANPDAPEIVRRLLTLPRPDPMGMGGVRILMTDGAKNDALLTLAKMNAGQQVWVGPGGHLARTTGTSPTVSRDPPFSDFETSFVGRFGMSSTADAFAPYAYDSFYALAIAVGSIRGDVTGAQMAAALRRIGGAGGLTPVGRSQYLMAVSRLQAGQNVPLDGASGPIRFRDASRESGLFEVWSLDLSNPQNPTFKSVLAP